MSLDPSISRRHVAAVPYPGRGHVNPLMNICRLIPSNKGILISFIVTEEWAHLITSSASEQQLPANVRLVTIPNCIPSEAVRARDFPGFLDAVYTKMEEPFEKVLEGLRPPVEGILADAYLPWAAAVGSRWNVPVYSLFTMSATFFSVLYHFDRLPAAAREAHVTAGGEPGQFNSAAYFTFALRCGTERWGVLTGYSKVEFFISTTKVKNLYF